MSKIVDIFGYNILDQLSHICNNIDEYITTVQKADGVIDLLSDYGFIELGCGTNRIVVGHPDYPEYAFKIALDSKGVSDNKSEFILSKDLAEVRKVATYTYETNGLVALAERVKVLNRKKFNKYLDTMKEILYELSSVYILNDVSPKSFLNWGIDKNKKLVICDYAYLTKVDDVKLTTCKTCGCKLGYKDDFSGFKCHDCGREYLFTEVIDIMSYASNQFEDYMKEHPEEDISITNSIKKEIKKGTNKLFDPNNM